MRAFDMEVPKASMNLMLIAMEVSGSFFYPCQKFANKKDESAVIGRVSPALSRIWWFGILPRSIPSERNSANILGKKKVNNSPKLFDPKPSLVLHA